METYVTTGYATQTVTQAPQTPKPIGLSGSLQSLIGEASETMNLAENISSSLGISKPSEEGGASALPGSPAEEIRMAVSALRIANAKLGGALQHINS